MKEEQVNLNLSTGKKVTLSDFVFLEDHSSINFNVEPEVTQKEIKEIQDVIENALEFAAKTSENEET